jgi:hypothetical protein
VAPRKVMSLKRLRGLVVDLGRVQSVVAAKCDFPTFQVAQASSRQEETPPSVGTLLYVPFRPTD